MKFVGVTSWSLVLGPDRVMHTGHEVFQEGNRIVFNLGIEIWVFANSLAHSRGIVVCKDKGDGLCQVGLQELHFSSMRRDLSCVFNVTASLEYGFGFSSA